MNTLLGTSAVVWLLRGDREARRAVGTFQIVYINAISLGELMYGVLKAGLSIESEVFRNKILTQLKLLIIGETTAKHYAIIEHELRSIGKPLADNDIWIAATAIEHDLTLLTFDHHFERVNGLKRVIL